MPLSDKFKNLMKFIAYTVEEPITKQHIDICPKNPTYISNTSAKSINGAMIIGASFISLYADGAGNSSDNVFEWRQHIFLRTPKR